MESPMHFANGFHRISQGAIYMINMKALTLGIGLAVASAVAAVAAPITSGTLGMAFTYQAENSAGANVPLGSATAIDFTGQNAGAPSTANTGIFFLTQATGDFGTAGLNIADMGTIHDLVFSPFASITPFFTVGTVSFDLTSITVTAQTNSTLGLTGHGIFKNGGIDPTAGTWAFSGNTAGSALTGIFTWSADATPIPEPMSLALFGAGLLGLGLVRRARNQA
jgi:hypothetical protein